VLQCCGTWKPDVLLTTGTAPVMRKTLAQARSLGVRCCNYSTDDPWNPEHSSRWFMQAISEYDFVFTPRCANLQDLMRISSGVVSRVPFAYDPDLFFPEHLTAGEARQFASDIVFAGGADKDRVPYIRSLRCAGIRVALYGSYWERFAETEPLTRGQADVATLRKAVAGSNIVLCLVRRANRDSHAMRSYEAPAMKACMVVEKTGDHLDLFGPEGRAVLYFDSVSEMVGKVSWLLDHPGERRRLAENAYRLVVSGGHTYRHRLQTMLARIDCRVAS
jgi:spore maturation protein CgeB